MRRMVDFYCYSCDTERSTLIDQETRKIECNQCEGTMHKCILAPMFKQSAGHGQVNTAGNLEFNKLGKRQAPPRSFPDEPDIERK